MVLEMERDTDAVARGKANGEALLAAARALTERIRALAGESERLRDMAPAMVELLHEDGLWDATKPAELGGPEVDLLGYLRLIEELSRADGSTGWTYMIGATTGYALGRGSVEAARAIYAQYPKHISGGSIVPRGKAVAVEGGYRVSGRFPFGSGIRHTQTMGSGCVVFDGDQPRMGPGGVPVTLVANIPTADYQVLDTWHVNGLRGTGSTHYAINDYFVPESHCAQWFTAETVQRPPLYRFPPISFLAAEVAPVGLGIARHAIEALIELASAKTPTGSMNLLRERTSTQADVARAEALLRAGRAFLYATVSETWDKVVSGDDLSLEDRALIRLAATTAVTYSAQAVDLMYNAGGATSIYESNPLERCFRDVHTLTQHIIIGQPTLEMPGKVFLGLDLGPALL